MSLSTFSITVGCDGNNGISKDGYPPWTSKIYSQWFREKTIGTEVSASSKGMNAVIMDLDSYLTIPEEHRPLQARHNIIITEEWKQDEHPEISIYPSLLEALAGCANNKYGEIFVCGGEKVYKEAVKDFLYLCRRIYVTKFKTNYECDEFFPFDEIKGFPQFQDPVMARDYTRYFFAPEVTHPEYAFLDLLKKVRDKGDNRPDRTGVGRRSLFGEHLEFDISERLPCITTKKVNYEAVIEELLWFLRGSTNVKELQQKGVKIWNDNSSKKFLEERKLKWEEGDIGPGYGFQWRHWGAEYTGCNTEYGDSGIDQIQKVIESIKKDPFGTRHIVSAWNVADLDKIALPPCHFAFQFYVTTARELNCHVFQRSADMGLGVPFNALSYAILTHMIAHVCHLTPKRLVFSFTDVHIYQNHIDGVNKQLVRTPRPLPTLRFRDSSKIFDITDFNTDNIVIDNYNPCGFIKLEMAV